MIFITDFQKVHFQNVGSQTRLPTRELSRIGFLVGTDRGFCLDVGRPALDRPKRLNHPTCTYGSKTNNTKTHIHSCYFGCWEAVRTHINRFTRSAQSCKGSNMRKSSSKTMCSYCSYHSMPAMRTLDTYVSCVHLIIRYSRPRKYALLKLMIW